VEYSSRFDFYLKFKPIYNKDDNFIDYILVYVSDSFTEAVNINQGMIMGKKFSEIVVDMDIFGFKEFYFNIIPKSKVKYELYIKELDRWYVINSFTDMSNNENELVIYYVDITDIKQNQHSLTTNNNIYD
jgi:hypothetical protein